MNFILVCGLITIIVHGSSVDVSGASALLGSQRLTWDHDQTYLEGQTRLIISKDHKTIWFNDDIDDRPGRGEKYQCNEE
jgi:hypothetical protein